ncbi:MAG TPA: PAS and helix-turn-helix domain-containing protein [Methylomirabilota bacterium]|nr:PAS and helix-turn-helix domain-containing protein [Methylomirabilota bacterium]
MQPEDMVLQSAAAAFCRGPDGEITAWNGAAERLFALPAGEVVGRRCCDVIAGNDVFGNQYCADDCACWRMAVRNRPIRPFRITSRDAYGRPLELRVSAFATRGGQGVGLVHVVEGSATRRVFSACPRDPDAVETSGDWVLGILTRRELEVLRLLAEGMSTDEIAEQLTISPTTVRNHVSRCLAKLDAHSRLEAVALARRLDLV